MESLKSLIRVLRPSEKRLLNHYYSRTTNAEEKLRLQLFKLVDAGVDSDVEARKKLGTKSSTSAYSHLKARLKNDILNVLLTQDSAKRIAQKNRAAEFDCRKKVAQSHLLLLRGAQIEGMKVLHQALATADRYELLSEKLQINHLLREYFVGAVTSSDLSRLNDAINSDLEKYRALLRVEEQSFLISSPEFSARLKSRANDKKNLLVIDELGRLYRKHKLARIGFWYYMAATEYHIARKDFEQVVIDGQKFLKLVEKKVAVRSKNNIAGVNQTLGAGYLELRQFNEAVGHFARSEQFFPAAGFNRLQCLQFLVQAEAAHGSYSSALMHVELAMNHPRILKREHLLPQWLYLKACIEFLSGDFSAALKSVNKDGYLIKQQNSWNIQFRLLEMLILLALRDEEWLEFKLDATRKFLTRHKKFDDLRVRAAVDVIGNLLRKDLDYSGLSLKNNELLENCLAELKGYEWNPSGLEIVRFDRWIQSQIPATEDE